MDNELVERVMNLYGLKTKREAIDFALRALVGKPDRRALLNLEGSGWEGDLDEMRHSEPPPEL